jgi:hypothetical protein
MPVLERVLTWQGRILGAQELDLDASHVLREVPFHPYMGLLAWGAFGWKPCLSAAREMPHFRWMPLNVRGSVPRPKAQTPERRDVNPWTRAVIIRATGQAKADENKKMHYDR